MNISCHLTIINRLLPTAGKAGPNRSCWSNLVLKEIQQDGRCLLHLTIVSAKHKQGITYKVTNNIENVFSKFIAQGKLTVRLREPQIDLQLSGDSTSLVEFLRVLRGERKCLKNSSTLNSSCKKLAELPKTKLIVSTKAEYPITTSFPHTLKILKLSGLCLKRFDRRILQLKQLEHLDLSNNQISDLPESVASLSGLGHLDLSNNKLKFLRKGFLSSLTSLSFLDLSHNELQALPDEVLQLRKLNTLKIKHNQLTILPKTFYKLSSLRVLNLACNQLTILPVSFERLSLDDIDVHENPFAASDFATETDWKPHTLTLKSMAGSSVLLNRVLYGPRDLPRELVRYLNDSVHCPCGYPLCFEDAAVITAAVNLLHTAASVTGNSVVPVEMSLCSSRCFLRYAHKIGFTV